MTRENRSPPPSISIPLSDEIQFIECSLLQVKYKTKQTRPPTQLLHVS